MIINRESTRNFTLEERPPYMLCKSIETVKDAVAVEDYLRDRGVEVRHGRARCLVHGGDNPRSFAVYPSEGRWHCFGCDEGGDVIDLCQALEGGEVWECMLALAQRFNVDRPERSEDWRAWQDEKGKWRRMVREAMTRTYQRRYFRVFGECLSSIEDPEEYERAAKAFYSDLRPVAVAAAENRLAGRG